jgi:hypothetical protein
MFELIGITIVCVTILVSLGLVLHYLKAYRIERSAWLEAVRGELQSMVSARLEEQANYRKDLEQVNSNQLALARELDLLKKTQQISTRMTRPHGSLV